MREIVVQLAAALLGSLGFGLLFGVRRAFLPLVSAGGCLSWGLYLLAIHCGSEIFPATLLAALFAAFYAEIFARVLKAPSTIFFIPTVIPLIPGGNLYQAMQAIVVRDWDAFEQSTELTMQYALGIAAGMCLAWAFCDLARKVQKRWFTEPSS